ncbi:pesticidal protein Cry7Aa [Flavobacterium sp. GT3R68]|uniref:glycoside hydrolase family 130 protein n=1 Tax=Flavobacterium sp. GT3R68 TaxID=2594437 RepID=UPI000F896DC2|nr:pesticidal protein Cry7Aa [Flavobacterium sp. GT3R68]RTY95287.1 pesticidal protein Cry7Aa [Flavobacterium sp. GSN2]TRW90972.1 pesticidal protein Cry7Aa [Flavobacterium sp. GT3R68]
MIKVKKEGILLEKTALDFENDGVLNPGIIKEGNTVHMFYRAVTTGNFSTIGYCELEGPLKVKKRWEMPIISVSESYESHGVEDPRIVEIDGTYYLTYVAFDGVNALGALATSTDLMHFEKKGLIVPQLALDEFKALVCSFPELNPKYIRYARHFKQEEKVYMWDKDVIFFPRKINGKFHLLHRIHPGIQIVSVTNLEDLTKEFWDNYFTDLPKHIVLDPIHELHESSYIGGGCPPIETEDGWLLIYHGVHDTTQGFVYSACAALLDLNDPQKEIARLPDELFKPDLKWELKGVTDNVVFPTGTALFDDTLYIYYGAADKYIACASVQLSELLTELKLYKK